MSGQIHMDGRDYGTIFTVHDEGVAKLVYRSKRKPEHYCVKYNGWGISVKIFNKIQEMGVDQVEIWYDGSRDWAYRISLDKFGENSICDKLGNFEPQLFCHVDHFEEKKRVKK